MKNVFVSEIFKFSSGLFGYVEKRLHKKVKVDFKIYDATDRTANNCNTDIVQNLNKLIEPVNEVWSVNRI